MQPFAAAGLEKRLQADLVQQRLGQLRGLDHAFPGQGGIRIEVQHEAVRMFQPRGDGIPGVQLNGAHLRRADQRFAAVDH
ncbi:hypothetical protein SSTU70S_05397 [Stutzerimonas stutzeri]